MLSIDLMIIDGLFIYQVNMSGAITIILLKTTKFYLAVVATGTNAITTFRKRKHGVTSM